MISFYKNISNMQKLLHGFSLFPGQYFLGLVHFTRMHIYILFAPVLLCLLLLILSGLLEKLDSEVVCQWFVQN